MAASPRRGSRPYIAALRARLIAVGFDERAIPEQIAHDLITNCGKRPREAWRLAAGLSLQAVADQINSQPGRDPGRSMLGKSRIWELEQWPSRSGVRPTLPMLRLLAQIYATSWDHLLDIADLAEMPPEDREEYHAVRTALHRQRHPAPPALGPPSPEPIGDPIHDAGARVLEEAADESARLADWARATNVTDDSLHALTSSLRGIAAAYLWSPPLPLLQRTRRTRNRIHRLVQGRQSPQHTRQLYLLNAYACSMLAWMTGDLGNHLAAGDHAAAAWSCAEMADSDTARSWVRATQAKVTYWGGDYLASAALAADGLTYPATDNAPVLLALLHARAAARVGRVDEAEVALRTWRIRREQPSHPDQIGGLLGINEAQQYYLAGTTFLELRQPAAALTHSHRALELFEEQPTEARFYGAEVITRLDATRAYLHDGDLDGAHAVIGPVFEVPPEQRLDTSLGALNHVRHCLAQPRYRATPTAQDLQNQIEAYAEGAIGRELQS